MVDLGPPLRFNPDFIIPEIFVSFLTPLVHCIQSESTAFLTMDPGLLRVSQRWVQFSGGFKHWKHWNLRWSVLYWSQAGPQLTESLAHCKVDLFPVHPIELHRKLLFGEIGVDPPIAEFSHKGRWIMVQVESNSYPGPMWFQAHDNLANFKG